MKKWILILILGMMAFTSLFAHAQEGAPNLAIVTPPQVNARLTKMIQESNGTSINGLSRISADIRCGEAACLISKVNSRLRFTVTGGTAALLKLRLQNVSEGTDSGTVNIRCGRRTCRILVKS